MEAVVFSGSSGCVNKSIDNGCAVYSILACASSVYSDVSVVACFGCRFEIHLCFIFVDFARFFLFFLGFLHIIKVCF